MARFVVITSGKGGTGKTTVALNLAAALAHFGREIILIDSNFHSPHVGLQLGYTNFQVNLHHALKGEKHIKEAMYRHQSGIKIIPSSIALDHLQYADIEKLGKLLPELDKEAEVVLLDSSTGLHAHTNMLIKFAHDLLVITTPEITSVADALKTIKLARKTNINILGVVVNKITNDGLDMTVESIQSILEVPVIGVIPEHGHVKESVRLKQPVVYSHPTSPVTDSFKMLAAQLIGEKYEMPQLEKDEGAMNALLKKFNMDYFKGKVQDMKNKIKGEKEDEDQTS